jgi:hypothetical protein
MKSSSFLADATAGDYADLLVTCMRAEALI